VMELEDIKQKYADPRRTEIVPNEAEIQVEDLIQEEDMVVTISHGGYLKRTPVSEYRAQRRGGKGKIGMEARDEDWVSQLFVASTHTFVFFFSDKGKVFVKKVYEIPSAPRNAKGRAIVNFVSLSEGEKVAAITPVPGFEKGKFVVTLTKRGQIKKTELSDYENYREKGIIGVKIEEGDQLHSAAITDGTRELLIATRSGMSIRFDEKEVRQMGRATAGVKGIELVDGDEVVGLCVASSGEDRVLLVTDQGQMLRIKASDIRETGRNAQGVRLMSVAEGERIVAIEVFDTRDEAGLTASMPPPSNPPEGDPGEGSAGETEETNGSSGSNGSNGSNGAPS